MIIIAGIGWGTSCVFVNFLEGFGFTSIQMTAVRFSTALIWMLVYCLIFNRSAFKVALKNLYLFVISGVLLYSTATVYYQSMVLTSSGTAVVLMYFAPIPVMLFSVLFFGEKFNLKKGIAVLLMLVGCIFVSGIIGNFNPNLVGILLGVLSAFLYAAYCIVNKICSKKKIDPFTFMLYTLIFSSVLAFCFKENWGIFNLVLKSPGKIIPVGLLHGLVTCMMPFLLYTVSLKYLSTGVATALSILEPLTGAILGFIFYSEPVTPYNVAGIVLVISSVLLLAFCEFEHPKPKEIIKTE